MATEVGEDDEHLRLVNRLYNHSKIDPSSFRRYRMLSHRDFGDESLWLGAPILVFTERERLTLQHSAAVRFARVTGVAVIRWFAKRSQWHQQPNTQHRATALQDPCFYEYFVANAESTLRNDVDREAGLTKGLHVHYHSLTMSSKRQETTLARRIAAASPGDVITLTQAPAVIHVRVEQSCFPRRFHLAKYPMEATHYVVPLRRCDNDPGIHAIVHGGKYFKPSIAHIHRSFPVVPNFVLTVKGAASFTFQRVILALSERNDHAATHEDLYLALSRVDRSANVRLLLRGETVAEKLKSLEYIRNLKQGDSVSGWDKTSAMY